MRALALVLGLTLGAATPALAGSAVERLVGVVSPTVGARVDGQGRFVGPGGTQPATVTRERVGDTLVVTVVPSV
jgi:hypothetical protein